MSDNRDIPNPETLARQPGRPSAGGVETVEFEEQMSPEDAVAEARAQKETAERERDVARSRESEAQRERDAAIAREAQAGNRAVSAQEQTLATQISAYTSAIDQAKADIANAQAAGDATAVADAFDRLAESRAVLRDLSNRKEWLDQQKKAVPERQAQPEGMTVRTPGGTMQGVAPAAKEWMDQHPRFYNDRDYYNHAVAAHSSVTAEGVQEGTPAYFKALSDQMQRYERFEAFERGDPKEPAMTEQRQPARTPARMSAAAMGAPVSRSSAPTNRNGVPDPTAIALKLGVNVSDLREYARINGFTAQRHGGDSEAAFSAYLKAHQEIADIERVGGDTGIKVDGAWR